MSSNNCRKDLIEKLDETFKSIGDDRDESAWEKVSQVIYFFIMIYFFFFLAGGQEVGLRNEKILIIFFHVFHATPIPGPSASGHGGALLGRVLDISFHFVVSFHLFLFNRKDSILIYCFFSPGTVRLVPIGTRGICSAPRRRSAVSSCKYLPRFILLIHYPCSRGPPPYSACFH